MAETTDLLVRLRSDASGFKPGVDSAQSSLRDLATEAAKVGAVFGSLAGAVALINRGQGVSELSAAFRSLGQTEGDLTRLRAATQGLISDVDLMRASNEALLAGLKPDQFAAVAQAADALGDAVGKNTKEALDALTQAMATGTTRQLERNYGLVIDNERALNEFAKSIGKTKDQLNELGQREAIRQAIITELAEKTKQLGESSDTAGDAFTRLKNASGNVLDRFAQAVNENQSLAEAIDSLAEAIAAIDVGKLVAAGNALATIASIPIRGITAAGQGLGNAAFGAADRIFNISIDEQIREAVADIERLSALGGQRSLLGRGPNFDAERQKEIAAASQRLADLSRIKIAAEEAARAAGALSNNLKGGTNGEPPTGDPSKFLDQAKVKAEEAARAWKEFNAELEFYGGFTDRVIGPAGQGTFFEKVLGAKDITYQEERLKQSFENSVNFFSDLLTPMFEGQAANFEDIFKDAAKRIAIGFASQMLASLALGSGFNPGAFGSAGGFGQALAVSAGFGGGGVAGLGALFGGAALAGGGGAGAVPGVPVVLSGTPAANFGVGSLGALGSIGGALLAAVTIQESISGLEKLVKGDKLGFTEQAALAIPTFGLSFLSDSFGFGGDSKKRKELEARKALLDQIFGGNASFQGVGGTINLDADTFTSGGAFGGQANALVNPLAEVLGGGGKLGDDLSNIFESGVSNAGNFNEVIVNTLSLMDRLGLNAEDTKDQLAQLFLDGKVSLDEFSVGIDNLNILAQEDLIGPNSVADAINIVTTNLDNPRVALKGLELAFKEMAELGIDTSAEVSAFLTDKFGPDIAEAFKDIMDAGIDTWQEVGEAGPEQLRVIFKELSPLQQVFEDTAEAAKELGSQNMDKLSNGLLKVKKNAEEAKKAIDRLNEAAAHGTGENPNQPNNSLGK